MFHDNIISKRILKIGKVDTQFNPSDIGTKIIHLNKFQNWLKLLFVDFLNCMYRCLKQMKNEIVDIAFSCTFLVPSF